MLPVRGFKMCAWLFTQNFPRALIARVRFRSTKFELSLMAININQWQVGGR